MPIKERSAKLRYPGHFGGNANGIKMQGIFAAFPGRNPVKDGFALPYSPKESGKSRLYDFYKPSV